MSSDVSRKSEIERVTGQRRSRYRVSHRRAMIGRDIYAIPVERFTIKIP